MAIVRLWSWSTPLSTKCCITCCTSWKGPGILSTKQSLIPWTPGTKMEIDNHGETQRGTCNFPVSFSWESMLTRQARHFAGTHLSQPFLQGTQLSSAEHCLKTLITIGERKRVGAHGKIQQWSWYLRPTDAKNNVFFLCYEPAMYLTWCKSCDPGNISRWALAPSRSNSWTMMTQKYNKLNFQQHKPAHTPIHSLKIKDHVKEEMQQN